MSILEAEATESTTAPAATAKEIMAATIAHGLRDGQWVEVGANLPVPRAGALLAHLTHGPNMTVMIAMTKAYLRDEPVIDEFEFITDVRAMRWAEAYYQHDQLLNNQRHRPNGVFFCGGLQVDAYGNSNLIGIGNDYERLKFRGPGGIGTCNATIQVGTWHLVTTAHNPRTLVEKVDFISALGYGRAEPGLRESLGLQNSGPSSIITPLCVFDFDELTHRARLKSLHAGVALQTVVENTGFEFDVPAEIPETDGPTPSELQILRTRIDAGGALR